jgi:hypothetical protein
MNKGSYPQTGGYAVGQLTPLCIPSGSLSMPIIKVSDPHLLDDMILRPWAYHWPFLVR